jgi:hypothetical protein
VAKGIFSLHHAAASVSTQQFGKVMRVNVFIWAVDGKI